jgi:hypothetical protein
MEHISEDKEHVGKNIPTRQPYRTKKLTAKSAATIKATEEGSSYNNITNTLYTRDKELQFQPCQKRKVSV